MPTDVNPERATNDSDIELESFWDSVGAATQVRPELPLCNTSNSMNTSVKVKVAKKENADVPQGGSFRANFPRQGKATF
jgi:hypothetical protein